MCLHTPTLMLSTFKSVFLAQDLGIQTQFRTWSQLFSRVTFFRLLRLPHLWALYLVLVSAMR